MSIIKVENLTKRYGDFEAVKGINFSVHKGEIFGFLGPNGAGKTTTINMLIGLAGITSGSAKLLGYDLTFQAKKAQKYMGIVPDESNLYEELDGFQNLSFCAALYGMKKSERMEKAHELLHRFNLADAGNKPFRAYSRGMKRRLTIAAGIIHDPKILFLDEPTTGIDVASARQIRELILDLNASGTTVFLTTHYIEEAERLCHRIAFIVDGKIVRIGTVNELMSEAQEGTIVQFTLDDASDPGLREALRHRFPEFEEEFISGNIVRIHSPSPTGLMEFMKFFDERKLNIYEAKIIRPSLEDVFVKITGIEINKMAKDKEQYKK